MTQEGKEILAHSDFNQPALKNKKPSGSEHDFQHVSGSHDTLLVKDALLLKPVIMSYGLKNVYSVKPSVSIQPHSHLLDILQCFGLWAQRGTNILLITLT